MTNKTPAMILQELAIKLGHSPPEYTIIHQIQGKHENEFEFQVVVLNIFATGKGRSKKEAKQETAKNALTILREQKVYQSDEGLPPPNVLLTNSMEDQELKQVHNYIGVLADTCVFYSIPSPDYIEISAAGPSHAMEFTYECRLGDSMITRTTSSTKRNAKQIVAKEMLERVHDIIPQFVIDYELNLANLNTKDLEAVEVYKDLSMLPKFNMGLRICDYNNHLRSVLNEKKLTFDDIKIYFEKPWNDVKLSTLLEKLELNYSYEDITDDIEDVHTIILNISADFPLATMGQNCDKESAENDARLSMFEILMSLLTPRLVSFDNYQ